jgi:hypothetical protein
MVTTLQSNRISSLYMVLLAAEKSRVIFETIKHQRQYQNQQHNTIEKFYIINPSQKIGDETGRIA